MIAYEIVCAAFCCVCVVLDVLLARYIRKCVDEYYDISKRLSINLRDGVDTCRELIITTEEFIKHE